LINNSQIITLTKSLWSNCSIEHKKCYWYGIYNILEAISTDDNVEQYLINEYKMYLTINGLGTRKVVKENMNIKNIGYLFDQALKAIQEKYNSSNITHIKHFFEPHNESIGVYFKHRVNQGYCCMYYDKPNTLFVTLDDSKEDNEYSFILERKYFDSNIDEQIQYLKDKLK